MNRGPGGNGILIDVVNMIIAACHNAIDPHRNTSTVMYLKYFQNLYIKSWYM